MQATAITPSIPIGQPLMPNSMMQAGAAQGGDFMQMIMQMMSQGSGDMTEFMGGSNSTASMEELLGLTGEQEDGEEENTDYLMQIMAGMLGHGMPQIAMYNDGNETAKQSSEVAAEIFTTVQAGLHMYENPVQSSPQLPAWLTATNPEVLTDISGKAVQPDSKVVPFMVGDEATVEVVTENYNKNAQPVTQKTDAVQMQELINSMGKPQQTVVQAANVKKPEVIDIDTLQQVVDSGRYLARGTTAVQELSSANPQTMDILAQVKTGILANMDKGNSEFVIKLKPEGLGEITVKMTEVAGKVSLSIITGSQQTQNALAGEISSLREALRPYNAEVSQVITQQDANLSQGFGEHKHGQQQEQQSGRYGWTPLTEDDTQPAEYTSALASALNAYI